MRLSKRIEGLPPYFFREIARKIANAMVQYLGAKRMVVLRDMRTHSEDIARELVGVCGAEPLLARARALRDAGDPDGRSLQMACHIADFVRKGDPDNRDAWLLWRDLFQARMATEPALMPRGAFHSAVRDAEARLAELGPLPNP